MRNRWNPELDRLLGVDLVCAVSRLLGAEESLVVWGGGNSSIKQMELDYRGREVRVLRVKGSGSDMKSLQPGQLAGIRMDDILAVFERDAMSDQEMVDYLTLARMHPSEPRGSIETLLHGFVPADHVYHTHADAIAAITDVPGSEAVVREIYGDRVAWIPYLRPGFALSQRVGRAVRDDPGLEGVILDKHGIITWGETARLAYDRMIDLVSRAEAALEARRPRLAAQLGGDSRPALDPATRAAAQARLGPLLRGAISRERRQLLAWDDSPMALRFAGWPDVGTVAIQGPATPDHLLYTKQRALVLDIDPADGDQSAAEAIGAAAADYADAYRRYFETHRESPDLTMLDPYPRTIIVPGVGIAHSGKDVRSALITRDIYRHSIAVMEGASSIDRFQPIAVGDICAFEYWPLENYKLSLLPPERELSRRIALVTGAGSGIGRDIARRLAAAGAAVAIADIDLPSAEALAGELVEAAGGFPVALPLNMDVRDPDSVAAGLDAVARTWGGLDIVVPNAGIARSAPLETMDLADWQATLDVNATGYFLTLRESLRLLRRQGLGGSIVLVVSKNGAAAGKDFGAYAASKGAELQLLRVAAMEAGDAGIRVNGVNPDAVFGGSQLWSDEIREQRARAHGVDPDDLESFYATRNILRRPITGEDVAEAVLWLASDRSAKTTGAFIPVDSGIANAFPR